ncbi:MAG TPA: sugar phosphate isomerase/epimerase [Propionibacteriaceae bacterium]|nr:sugar phosphate isomerase/epimerase [Propionibacteriaceae bacterium]
MSQTNGGAPKPPIRVSLSTTSVYPETTASGFELAALLGYDGIELMVGIDPVASDIDYMEKLRDYHQVAVHAIHAPCLLVTQTTWGNDPWEKLDRSAEAAHRLGADVVVVHPPFRWQRDYARTFVQGIKRLNEESGVTFSVENMYPWRMAGPTFQAYLPGWDPSELDYDHLTLDLSHASTSKVKAMDYVDAWGPRLRHVHLTDGNGAKMDAHLLPGEGDQDAWHLVEELARRGFDGQIVLEVNTRGYASRSDREMALGRVLADIRSHLQVGAALS